MIAMTQYGKIFIDGAWVASSGTGTIYVYDSTNGEVLAAVPDGTAEDVDRAATAAARAFASWSQTTKTAWLSRAYPAT